MAHPARSGRGAGNSNKRAGDPRHSWGVFVDRDGVLNFDRPDYVKSWAEFKWVPGALDAMRMIAALPAAVIVVTNQAAINRGLTTREAVEDIHARMSAEIGRHGGRVTSVRYCPHRPEEGCLCRKPAPGLLTDAAADLGLYLPQSFMIGDRITDMQAALAAGCAGIFIGEETPLPTGVLRAKDLGNAAIKIEGIIRARPG